jgi:hypothetical protein
MQYGSCAVVKQQGQTTLQQGVWNTDRVIVVRDIPSLMPLKDLDGFM